MMQNIHILLPVHNRRKITERFIDCLAAQTHANYHLILIDDGSTDGTAEMVQDRIDGATVIKGSGEWWWAGSLQQGINWLERHGAGEQDIIAFANDDTTFEVDFLQRAADILDELEGTLLLPYLRDEKTGLPQESGLEADLKKLTFIAAASHDRINCLPTRWLFMRMYDLLKIGKFHTLLLPHYLSDYEFTIRAHKKGLRLTTSRDIAIQLDRSQTGYRDLGNPDFYDFLKRYFSKRNPTNPIFWSAFILLVAPTSSIPGHLWRLWVASIDILFYKCAGSLRKWLSNKGV